MTTSDPHILVTGSSRGIGKAIVGALQGRAVVAGHGTIEQDGRLRADFAVPGAAPELWDRALDQLDGRIDVLINNAGIFDPNPVTAADAEWLDSWNRTMQINLTAAAELCRLAVRHFQNSSRPGRIINIASRAAYRGDSPDHWHYAASKGGMVAMTKTIARAYASEDILAFAICPGFTMTGMAEDYLESRGGDKLLADIPLGRVAQPDEIASMAVYCAVDAPPSMTGAVLDANGASFVR
ncbi:NAD(P)-dependent dehydrogenase, short-chain alcohol dehydrogenase family [Parasphingorhabdus marina DSM 22363]|uniref:NAD(P)-dependent dehydrogenase, short-chain alcohol dehydrogenase family n=1 Tax=Parasphingorhabdus marina DSM 22363 TaxID=1123272 RepID=A0A1N6EUF9_9SPHN|nr:SDR family oxidoreductase [Parasphingorhabdus marina]SIN86719.1 NAD(P)-dependent dehydrogenase, short-chain alcohol dehydrogenase family [Parasphingorhabdus marina DSM 22363]